MSFYIYIFLSLSSLILVEVEPSPRVDPPCCFEWRSRWTCNLKLLALWENGQQLLAVCTHTHTHSKNSLRWYFFLLLFFCVSHKKRGGIRCRVVYVLCTCERTLKRIFLVGTANLFAQLAVVPRPFFFFALFPFTKKHHERRRASSFFLEWIVMTLWIGCWWPAGFPLCKHFLCCVFIFFLIVAFFKARRSKELRYGFLAWSHGKRNPEENNGPKTITATLFECVNIGKLRKVAEYKTTIGIIDWLALNWKSVEAEGDFMYCQGIYIMLKRGESVLRAIFGWKKRIRVVVMRVGTRGGILCRGMLGHPRESTADWRMTMLPVFRNLIPIWIHLALFLCLPLLYV